MEKEETRINIFNPKPLISLPIKKRSHIKISLNTLYHLFGWSSFQIYNKFLKNNNFEIPLHSNLIQETRKKFEAKSTGFFLFVDDYVQKLKNFINNRLNKKNVKSMEFCDQFKDLKEPYVSPIHSRHILIKQDEIFRFKEKNVILIQKNIRRFLAYLRFLKMFKEFLRLRLERGVILIQKSFRGFSKHRKFKIFYLKYRIYSNLIFSKKAVRNSIENYFNQMIFKKNYIAYCIINSRKEAIKLLQERIKYFLYKNKIKELINKERSSYFISYPFVANDVKLIVYINKKQQVNSLTYEIKEKIYCFEFCKIRKMFVLHINQEDFKPGKYRVKMIIDNLVTCDGRFPHIEFSDGYYYNIIDFSVKNKNYKDGYYRSFNLTNTRDNTNESDIKKENLENISDKSIRYSSNSCSSNSFIKELKKKRATSFDQELKENLANKKSYSYVELIKESLNEDNHENNFD
jgi:hypothetical protein